MDNNRYTANSGQVMILDVTQRYFGSLDNSITQKSWPYNRPTDNVRR